MKTILNLRVKMTLALVSVVGATLLAVLAIVTSTLHTQLAEFSTTQGLQIVVSRADQVGTLLRLVESQLTALATRDDLRTGRPVEDQKRLEALHAILPPEVRELLWVDPSGRYSTSIGPASGNLSDRSYFRQIMTERQSVVVSEAVVSKSLGVPIVVIAVPVLSGQAGPSSLLGAMVSLENLSKITAQIKAGPRGYGWIVDKTGLILAYPDAAEVMSRNVTDSDKDGFQGLDVLGRRMIAGTPGWGEFVKPDHNRYVTYFSPIPQSPGWVLGMALPERDAQATERNLQTALWLVLLGAVILAILVGAVVARQLSRPITGAARQFRELSRADADLTVQLPVTQRDEIGQLAADFNKFVARLRELIGGLKEAQDNLRGVGTELGDSVKSSLASINAIGVSVGTIRDQSSRQSQSVVASSTAVEEIAHNIESLDQLIQQQASAIVQGSSSVEEMAGNIASIRDSAGKMSEQFHHLSSVIASVKEGQASALAKIQAMSDQSAGLLEANRLIAGLSSQTNLLAMNAAIEAAHAGDAGRGFSVVADEIRKLAETSAAESKRIGRDLKAIQGAIQGILESARTSGAAFTHVEDQISQTETIVRGVNEALIEQEEGSTQMLQALRDMNQVTAEVQNGSQEMRVGNATILAEIQTLRMGTSAIEGSLERVEHDAESVTTASQQVDALTARTRQVIDEMDSLIGRFRV